MELTREDFLNEYWKCVKIICSNYHMPFNKVVGNNAYLCDKGVYNPTIIKEKQMAKNLGISYNAFLDHVADLLLWEDHLK